MTNKQLQEALKNFPDETDVFMAEHTTDFPFALLNQVWMKEIKFSEEPGSKEMCRANVILLTE